MKHVVVSEDLREFEIHPPKLLNKYLSIVEEEIKNLVKKWDLKSTVCPGCKSKEKNIAFKKYGMSYAECKKCKTLYATPRPSEDEISDYYKTSESMDFWNQHFYKETILPRKRVIFRPRALWIVNLTEKYFTNPEHFIDVKAKYYEFIEELNSLNLFRDITLVDPLIDFKQYPGIKDGTKIVEQRVEHLQNKDLQANAISLFEVIDGISNPEQFIKKTKNLLTETGLLFITTSTISGFDMQTLWDHSKNIYPLDHINLFSTEGIRKLLNRCGFEIVELSTTGQLDLEIVKNTLKNNPDLEVSRFIRYLIENRDETTHRVFQDFLQRFNLSSHLRIAARKK